MQQIKREPSQLANSGFYPFCSSQSYFFSSTVTFAHCDTMDGPLIADAHKAISQKNVNFVLKWVPAANETEIKDAFNQMIESQSA